MTTATGGNPSGYIGTGYGYRVNMAMPETIPPNPMQEEISKQQQSTAPPPPEPFVAPAPVSKWWHRIGTPVGHIGTMQL
jgi:hypothetical protein